ncbi:unnamed protein product [Periconia digitata]|uniref:Uncharacterized protein n=1 Tax=Periconia digitata TaxID=1303443 RepID=A0A9W4U361_9PLEO|nr:unnamed protein product [Periconia digitata]
MFMMQISLSTRSRHTLLLTESVIGVFFFLLFAISSFCLLGGKTFRWLLGAIPNTKKKKKTIAFSFPPEFRSFEESDKSRSFWWQDEMQFNDGGKTNMIGISAG